MINYKEKQFYLEILTYLQIIRSTNENFRDAYDIHKHLRTGFWLKILIVFKED